jgi:hypothetical protein
MAERKFELMGNTSFVGWIKIVGTNTQGTKVSTIQKVSVIPNGEFDFISEGDDPDFATMEAKFTLLAQDDGSFGDMVMDDGDRTSPNVGNFTINLAVVSFISGNTEPLPAAVWRDLGYVDKAKLTLDEIATKKKYSKRGPIVAVALEAVVKKGGSITLTLAEETVENMQLVLSGGAISAVV